MRYTERPDKEVSWLRWPVMVNNCRYKLHITAKFFGNIPIDPIAVIARVPLQQSVYFANEFSWVSSIFSQGVYVLELTKFPPALRELHNRFDIIEDEFKPWRPHISVPQDYWIMVNEKSFTPKTEDFTIGEIELCMGTKNKNALEAEEMRYANHY